MIKKLLAIIFIIFVSFNLFADTWVYTSVSHEKYKADYFNIKYLLDKKETSYETDISFSVELGYKENISKYFSTGISYGYSYVIFEEDLLIQTPFTLDFYYGTDIIYGCVSSGVILTNNLGSVSLVPIIELGFGVNIPLKDFCLGLQPSFDFGVWFNGTNVSEGFILSRLKPLEIKLMFKQ